MRAHRNGSKTARRLRGRVLWVCLAGGLFALAMIARPDLRVGFAQPGLAQAETPQEQTGQDASPEPSQTTNQQSSADSSNPDANHRAGKARTEPQAPEFEEPVKAVPEPEPKPESQGKATPQVQVTPQVQAAPQVRATFSDPKQQEIADESAALLKLANSLKADMDKTTQDTLSVAVIRHADEIEKLAHKMRTK